MLVGNANDAFSALLLHRRAASGGDLDRVEGCGEFDGWEWWRGADRVTWHFPGRDVVYKIEKYSHSFANSNEHDNAAVLRKLKYAWAPDTQLHLCGDGFVSVLAMSYYPIQASSGDQIPVRAIELGIDANLANYRFAGPPPSGQVKAIDLGDILPSITMMGRRADLHGQRNG